MAFYVKPFRLVLADDSMNYLLCRQQTLIFLIPLCLYLNLLFSSKVDMGIIKSTLIVSTLQMLYFIMEFLYFDNVESVLYSMPTGFLVLSLIRARRTFSLVDSGVNNSNNNMSNEKAKKKDI